MSDVEFELLKGEVYKLVDKMRISTAEAFEGIFVEMSDECVRTLSKIRRYKKVENCTVENIKELRELVLDCVTKTMFRDLTTFRMGLFRAGEAYQYLEEAMEKIDKGVESIEDLYRVKRSAENAIDSFVGAGLAGTKGKVSLGRSIRRWWRGVGS